MNIKNPLFTQMADFFVFFLGECGVERGIDVLLRWLWEWKGLVQREGQARQGRLSVCAQGLCKDAKPTKHTQTLALRKASGIVCKI